MDCAADLAAHAFAHPVKTAFFSTTACTALFTAYWLYHIFLSPYFSSIRCLPGPPPAHPLWGNASEALDNEPGVAFRKWTDEYGGAVRFRHLLGEEQLLITDPVALNYVLNSHVDSYPKPPVLRADIHMLLGGGLAWADGDSHRRQRRLMAPAFTPGPLKAWVPLFFDLSYQLRDMFRARIDGGVIEPIAWGSKEKAEEYASTKRDGEAVIEMTDWVTRLTLDALGKSSFGYEFNAMQNERNELAQALYALFIPHGPPLLPHPAGLLLTNAAVWVIRNLYQRNLLRFVPHPAAKFLVKTFKQLDEESGKIIDFKTGEKTGEKYSDDPAAKKRDLLSIFHTPAARDAMSREELCAQLKTFVFAGHETVSTTITWVLWWLAGHPEKQDRLRAEIRAARRKAVAEGREELTADEMYSLPYLDAVLREVLRLEGTITSVPRIAKYDDLIPLAIPVRSAIDPSKTISHIPVKKGQYIEISIYAYNRTSSVFGEDVDAFRPERWLDSENKIEGKVGVYSSMLTFLHGQRACPGWKYGMYQMKAILSVLLDDFEFEPREPGMRIEHRTQMIARPFVVGEQHLGSRLPMKVLLARENEAEE
ncbi:hypothetical protein JCM11641_004914 [Rhodosporidiobolus odoratus]